VSKTVTSILFSDTVIEKNLTKAENISNHPFLLYYFGGSNGDGTWRKRGFVIMQGISLIKLHSGKVLDVIVKSSYCKQCEYWKDKYNSAKFEL